MFTGDNLLNCKIMTFMLVQHRLMATPNVDIQRQLVILVYPLVTVFLRTFEVEILKIIKHSHPETQN